MGSPPSFLPPPSSHEGGEEEGNGENYLGEMRVGILLSPLSLWGMGIWGKINDFSPLSLQGEHILVEDVEDPSPKEHALSSLFIVKNSSGGKRLKVLARF